MMGTQRLAPRRFRIVGLVVGIPGFQIRCFDEVWWELRVKQKLRVGLADE